MNDDYKILIPVFLSVNRFLTYKLDHLLFWMLTVFFHGYTRLPWINKVGIGQFMLELIVRNGLLACAIYLTILFSIPRLTNGKQTKGIFGLLIALIIYVLGKNAHDVYFYGYVVGDPDRQNFFYNTFYNLSIVTFYLAFATTLYLSKQWYLQREQMRKIELEKLNTELEYLRAQINPHFLFNSINTIYFQIDKQNQAARETLNKFADMLRYQLYECNGNEIAIEKEVAYLDNYVNLQRLRKSTDYEIRFNYATDLINFTIPPLLLIPFVENAFKHVSNFIDRKNEITIELKKTDNLFTLTVTNTYDKESLESAEPGGIGLKNVKRRLDLLYDDTHRLIIQKSKTLYSVTLELPLL